MDRTAFEFDAREHPSLFVDMEREVVNTDHARIIRQAISRLNENQQKVIELAYYEGLSQSEMAETDGRAAGDREDLGAHGTEKSCAMNSVRR